jgi:hypothetical protein
MSGHSSSLMPAVTTVGPLNRLEADIPDAFVSDRTNFSQTATRKITRAGWLELSKIVFSETRALRMM